ncbi:N-acetyltransferase [Nocardioides sp. KIGAM211]|uniref:N-acetyltransferase n=1 Tax=Nocardioides luti TaxID=2761101 RepID=A0A7X0VA45_9ACTN|nr:GNAT family N-acetyltransferase [Nocardioides luti]MBB6625708.1 N-acetyltransferase [Nocardioides luti]
MADTDTVETTHNADEHRYEARIGGELAGVAVYELEDRHAGPVIVFTHTEVDDAFEGKGVGSALARFALDDVRRTGERRVVPQCPFIKGWIDKHPDYADLV